MTPDQLRKARAKLGLSLTGMAKELGIGRRTYIYRESGEMPIDRLMQLAVYWLLLLKITKTDAVVKKIQRLLK